VPWRDDATTVVADALTRHYAEHRLPPDGGASQAWFIVHAGPLRIPLPNPPARRRAVLYHDLNHVLTGYDTRFSGGEMSIAAFEVAAGCGRAWIAWYINLVLMALAIVVRPRLVWAGFVRGRQSGSVYRRPESRSTLLAMTVADARRLVSVAPPTATPRPGDRAALARWSAVAWLIVLATYGPIAAVVWAVVWAVVRR
jgi:hypothetical protein